MLNVACWPVYCLSFKGKDLDARDIGRRLNVDTIVEGSVKKAGDQLRVSVQLINADNGFQLWSERFGGVRQFTRANVSGHVRT